MKNLLTIILFAFYFQLSAQPEFPFFKHITVEQGLSNNWVKTIVKDKEGFMWFGTFNKLNRFDGHHFKIFSNSDFVGLKDNFIQSIAVDTSDNIWVGTFSGGLSRFDKKSETFENFLHETSKKSSISSNKVNTLLVDQSNHLWIGTDKGLNLFLPNTKTFKHFDEENTVSLILKGQILDLFEDAKGNIWIGSNNGLCVYYAKKKVFQEISRNNNTSINNQIRSIYEDKFGNIWLGTSNGTLEKFDLEQNDFTSFELVSDNRISKNAILDIKGDGNDEIYIATEGDGLFIYNISKKQFSNYISNPTENRTINSNSVHSFYFDTESQILWVGTYNGGINYFSKWDKPFQLFRARVNGLNNNYINAFTEDKNGNWWIGTDGGGLNFYEVQTQRYRYFDKQSSNLQSDAILSLLCDSENNIWVGSYNGGLDVLKNGHSSFINYRHDSEDNHSISGQNISAIYEDKKGNIWVGTMDNGLNLYDKSLNHFVHFKHQPKNSSSIIDNFIYGILEDSDGRILVQTGKGLDIFNVNSQTFERFNNYYKVDFNVPVSLLEDSQNNLWIGTQENGIFRIDRAKQAVKHYTIDDGLISNSIAAILEDDYKNIWISSVEGLCKLEAAVNKTEQIHIKKYISKDGLQGSEFKRNAVEKLQNGHLVFGGQNGFNVFNPVKVKDNPFIPPVVLTDFKLFNKSVNTKEHGIFNSTISTATTFTLTHQQSVFTFEFAALNYIHSEKNQYAYKLEGLEKEWNYVGTKNEATYTNLDAGTYIFRVKACNNDGVWNEDGVAVKVIVLPPWWEDNRYRLPIFFLLFMLLFAYYKYRTYQYRQTQKQLTEQVNIRTADLQKANEIVKERQAEILNQNKILSQKNQELARKATEIRKMSAEIEDLSEARIRFFTNISHELRTPLNLILWPLEELLQGKHLTKDKLKQKYKLMYSNADKLIRLINQLLDFRKIETGALQLTLEERDIVRAVQETMNRFNEWSVRKSVDFKLSANVESFMFYFDEDKLDKILSNLISNAFKFVNENGQIHIYIHVNEANQIITIKVIDNGQGIAAAKLPYIFNRFFEGDNVQYKGSGVGLALTKNLVEIHGGNISVESQYGEGTTFIIELPTDLKSSAETFAAIHEVTSTNIDNNKTPDVPSSNLKLLLVEDNLDIIDLMQQQLSEYYQIEIAHNGQEGLEKAIQTMPDLIISDVMMPQMNGFEMCELLKKDEQTSHIPIIMVTARSGAENELEGLQIGADDYISKPYSIELLQLKIKNILQTQQRLKAQFANNLTTTASKLNINNTDKAFLNKAALAVHENLNNPEFSAEDFSRYFQISRRHVLRKIKTLTGLSINEYIRVTRLKEAYQLLQNEDLNVSEVAYSVGFTDPKYFSNCFKKQFGKSPSAIMHKG